MLDAMFRLFVAAIVLSCLSTPASTQTGSSPPASAAPASKPSVKTVIRKPAKANEPAAASTRSGPAVTSEPCGLGVIVAVGDEFMVKRVGFDFLNNQEKEVPIVNWGLDDLIFTRVRAAAPRGVTVRRIFYQKSVQPSEELKNRFFRDQRAELVDVMRQVTAGTSCNRYVMVGRSISKFNETTHTVRGIGMIDWDVPLNRKIYVFALSFIRVFDGRDFSIVRQGSAITQREPLVKRMLLGELMLGPYSEVSESSFPREPEQAAGNLALREYARALLTAGLDKTLPWMLRP